MRPRNIPWSTPTTMSGSSSSSSSSQQRLLSLISLPTVPSFSDQARKVPKPYSGTNQRWQRQRTACTAASIRRRYRAEAIAFGVQREGNVDETVTAWKFHMHGRARRRRWRGGRKGLLHLLPFFLVAAVFNLGPPGPRPLSLSACFANSEAKTNP